MKNEKKKQKDEQPLTFENVFGHTLYVAFFTGAGWFLIVLNLLIGLFVWSEHWVLCFLILETSEFAICMIFGYFAIKRRNRDPKKFHEEVVMQEKAINGVKKVVRAGIFMKEIDDIIKK